MPNKQEEPLASYRKKRDPDLSPEPFGGRAIVGAPTFSMHHHRARRAHYDLRLAVGDSLWSWAIPKGPSPNPDDKRLAIRVEDHPLEYAVFEGEIPKGEYGGGVSIVWDIGHWQPLLDPHEGLIGGKLLFNLQGFKLQGRWTLVKSARSSNEWLLIKERDGYASDASTEDYPSDSVLSGLSAQQWEAGDFPAPGIRRRLARMKLPNIDRATAYTPVMLATRCAAAFSRKEWVYEVKYDGYRLLTHAQGRSITLSSRAGSPLTSAFPEIALAARALPFDHFVIDGEIVVHDAQGLPSFSALQQRARLSQRHDIDHAAARRPATLYAIDLLSLEGKDLRGLPLTKRKALLGEMLPTRGPIRLSEHVVEAGIPMYEQITELGLEGMVAKRADSPYESGRSENWLKIVAEQTDDFAVVGYRKHQTRDRLSALLLAHYTGDGLTYVGRVGSGFTEVERQNLFETLQSAKPAPPPLAAPRDRLYHWIEPKWVAEVRFKAWTQSRNLREPRFLRFRDDKPPSDCRADIELASMMPADESPQTRGSIPGQHAPVTNRDKIYWPADEITKGALIDYYRAISPWLLPYLADRPLVMTRFPDGIDGKSFFQHDAPASTPSWVRTERVWTGHQSKEVSTFIVDNVESLTYIVNLGCIPIHVWSSRLDALDRPDWCLLDLDPKGAPFGDVVTVAKTIHRLCAGAGIPTYPKTTGSSGMHVLIPLGKQLTHRESRQLSEIIARLVANALPDIVSLNRRITQRAGRVYIDFLQNGHGKLMAAPFAARPIPGAPVSMPMTWRQVTPKLDARRYTIRNAMRRMGQSTGDPMRPVLDENVDITAAIARLLNDRSLSEP